MKKNENEEEVKEKKAKTTKKTTDNNKKSTAKETAKKEVEKKASDKKVAKEDKEKKGLYKYPHNYGGYVEQQYLPDSLAGKVYYQPKNNGYEKVIKEIRKNKGKKD